MNRIRTTITAAVLTIAPLAVIIATAAPRVHM
jgi:hypothetical protein